MELNLVVPVPEGNARLKGDEKLNGKWWRVKGPIASDEMSMTKFHCVSYVWGKGVLKSGGFFNCQIDISDKSKPVLEAAMKAADTTYERDGGERVDAFWIDAICVPQIARASRQRTLESMGFIYSTAVSVIVVLQGAVWEVFDKASASKATALLLSEKEMEALEMDTWISRVWTYQEMVNNGNVHFTTISTAKEQVVVSYEPLLCCLGYSSQQWRKENQTSQSEFLKKFPNLNNLEDTLLDARASLYLERSALAILSNISLRSFDPQYPGNRLLASLGALTKEMSWSPAATLSDLSEKVMLTCEAVNDYSFIYTSDVRDLMPGFRWRPSSQQPGSKDQKPIHLVPVLVWASYGVPFSETQRARRDSTGFWLENMMRLQPSDAMDRKVEQKLHKWFYSWDHCPTPTDSTATVELKEMRTQDLIPAMFKALSAMGFKGSTKCQVCENGLFFPVINLDGRQGVELFVTKSIRWVFGAPGLARWKVGNVFEYSAGVFTGGLDEKLGEALLM